MQKKNNPVSSVYLKEEISLAKKITSFLEIYKNVILKLILNFNRIFNKQ